MGDHNFEEFYFSRFKLLIEFEKSDSFRRVFLNLKVNNKGIRFREQNYKPYGYK